MRVVGGHVFDNCVGKQAIWICRFLVYRFISTSASVAARLISALVRVFGFVCVGSSLVWGNEGHLGFCRAANLALTNFLAFRPESRWIVELFSTALADFGLASGSFEMRDSVLEFAHLVVI